MHQQLSCVFENYIYIGGVAAAAAQRMLGKIGALEGLSNECTTTSWPEPLCCPNHSTSTAAAAAAECCTIVVYYAVSRHNGPPRIIAFVS